MIVTNAAFLTAALLSSLCTLALLHRLAVAHRLHIVALAAGFAWGFVGVLAIVGQGG